MYNARRALRAVATWRAGKTFAELEARNDAIYRIEREDQRLVLRGLAAQKKKSG